MPEERKGAVRRADVTEEIRAGLDGGTEEAATLAEGLTVDFAVLISNAFPETIPHAHRITPSLGVTKRMALAGQILIETLGIAGLERVKAHSSDTVRGWAAYMIAEEPSLTLRQRLDLVRSLADDSHFGVREWAWIALRPCLAAELEESIALLTKWTTEPAANLRRFAVESLRPRGVWCSHIQALKENPDMGLPLLQPLRSDTARYVQDSVANWLNDASKSQPDWVRTLTDRWLQESPTPETARICKRALRTLTKKSVQTD